MNIEKVEKLFKKHIEFNSKSELLRKLGGSISRYQLDKIITQLEKENKILVHDDRAITWIDIRGNKKMMKLWKSAVPFSSIV